MPIARTLSRAVMVVADLVPAIWFAIPARAQVDAIMVVNTVADTHDKTPGDRKCSDAQGKCSLRAAIEELNAIAGPVLNEVVLGKGFYKLESGMITIASKIHIQGQTPADTIIDGGGKSLVFYVSGKAQSIAEFHNLTVQNGLGAEESP